jgi:hypothetical protein
MPVEGNIDGRKLDLKIQVDRSAEIEELQRQLEDMKTERDNALSEKEQLEGELSIIAEKQLNAKCQKYNVDPDLPSEAKIKKIIRIEQEQTSISPEPPNQERYNEVTKILNSKADLLDKDYDTLEDLVIDVQKTAKNETDPTQAILAQAVLDVMTKEVVGKNRKKPVHIELESGISGLARKPSKTQNETKEQFDKRMEDYLKRQKWKNVEGEE